jgi:hypothetical protein
LQKIKDNFLDTLWLITSKGSETEPIWIFKAKPGEKVLIGTLTGENLGKIKILGKPCSLDASFELSSKDFYITEVSGIFPEKIATNKKSIIKIIILKYLEKKFKPFISRNIYFYE